MKNQKHTPRPWTISNNTDTVDIDDKCIGLSPRRSTIPRDVAEHIHANRGLHIQIRHNGDAQAFAQANELARLIAAAPDLLEAIVTVVNKELGLSFDALCILKDAIRKARGN